MNEAVLCVLATSADIAHLEEHRTWEPMVLPRSYRDMNRVEIIDVSSNLIHTAFEVEDWREVTPDSQIVAPTGIRVDKYLDPIRPDETLMGDISEQVFGVRHRSAMHMRNEAHWHPLQTWLEAETRSGHKQLAKECARCSVDLRNDADWRNASRMLHAALQGWDSFTGRFSNNTRGVLAPN